MFAATVDDVLQWWFQRDTSIMELRSSSSGDMTGYTDYCQARRLQKDRAARITANVDLADFGGENCSDGEDSSDSDEDGALRQDGLGSLLACSSAHDAAAASSSATTMAGETKIAVTRDFSTLTSAQRQRELVKKHPELPGLLEEYKTNTSRLRTLLAAETKSAGGTKQSSATAASSPSSNMLLKHTLQKQYCLNMLANLNFYLGTFFSGMGGGEASGLADTMAEETKRQHPVFDQIFALKKLGEQLFSPCDEDDVGHAGSDADFDREQSEEEQTDEEEASVIFDESDFESGHDAVANEDMMEDVDMMEAGMGDVASKCSSNGKMGDDHRAEVEKNINSAMAPARRTERRSESRGEIGGTVEKKKMSLKERFALKEASELAASASGATKAVGGRAATKTRRDLFALPGKTLGYGGRGTENDNLDDMDPLLGVRLASSPGKLNQYMMQGQKFQVSAPTLTSAPKDDFLNALFPQYQ